MSPAFAIAAAAGAAACGWPACALVAVLATTERITGRASSAGPASPPSADAIGRPGRPGTAAVILTSLLLAALGFGVAVRLHPALVAMAGCWLAACGVPLGVIDARTRRLPDVLTGACLAGLAVLLTAAAAVSGDWPRLATSGCGALATAAFFAVLALAKPGSAGLGDAKLGLSTGAVAAWFGWLGLLWAMFAAFALAACYGLTLIAAGRASLRGSSLPFGPFLLAGCLLTVVLVAR